MELALKIASKIRADERFAVYIVIPMWPEGVPSSASVQEILYWQVIKDSSLLVSYKVGLINSHCLVIDGLQGQTMQMMYEVVAKELKAMKVENAHPQDYLNFYCLGNREKLPDTLSCHVNQTNRNGESHTVIIHLQHNFVKVELSWAFCIPTCASSFRFRRPKSFNGL